MMMVRKALGFFASLVAAAASLSLAAPAGLRAAELKKFTPQGEVGQVEEVRAEFTTPMIAAGQRGAPAPFLVDCPVPAQSYWTDQNVWVHSFTQRLPAGVKCQFTSQAKLQDLKGTAVKVKASYRFTTGGPRVEASDPPFGAIVEEHGAFVLSLSAPADKESVLANAYCSLAGVVEKVPLKILEGKDRDAILQNQFGRKPTRADELIRYEARAASALVVQCAQAATPASKMSIVWGAGIKSTSGIAQSQTRRHEYTVQQSFSAEMSCERENAQAACTPIRPITVLFTSPIPTKVAEQIRLKTPDGTRSPKLTDEAKKDGWADQVRFMPPFAEKAELSLDVPRDIKDAAGRSLANAGLFPLKFSTALAPPLAKFANSEFALVERKAEPLVPITLRRIEQTASAQLRLLKVEDDAQILAWFGKLRGASQMEQAGGSDPNNNDPKEQDSRKLSLLKAQAGVQTQTLPKPKSEAKDGEYPFEVVGLPMPNPGFYVMELESTKLGASLLAKPAPMYVKSSALVSNLAVHFRQGQDNSLVWVTTLDQAKPVKDAALRITTCDGKKVWEGKSDAQGKALVPLKLSEFSQQEADCAIENAPRFLVSARATIDGASDLGFVLSDWNKGIETWRYNLRYIEASRDSQRHKALLDRSLFRAGETLSLKLYSRQESVKGLSFLPKDKLPAALEAVHIGSNDRLPVKIDWKENRYAKGSLALPKEAKLGLYELRVVPRKAVAQTGAQSGAQVGATAGDSEQAEGDVSDGATVASFRVSEFKLPSMTGRVQPQKGASLIAPTKLPVALQLDYLSSGPAAGHAMTVSALTSRHRVNFEGFESYSFSAPDKVVSASGAAEGEIGGSEGEGKKLIADKLAAKLDAKGTGQVTIDKVPALREATELLLEASYNDDNGEIQTLSHQTVLWPAAVVVGLSTDSWVSVDRKLNVRLVALSNDGKPLASQNIEVFGRQRETFSARKRLVGGFYAYDNNTQYKDLGRLCQAQTTANGLANCALDLKTSGNIELIVRSKDSEGRLSEAFASVWVTERGEMWFDGENQDRIDLIPEKRRYQPGDTAKFQVRMPFRMATALVSIEREGVIESFTVQLTGKDPSIEVPIKGEYGPNVFVSALVVRERLREVPWYSFLTWGWRSPRDWWQAFRENLAPTATVDLAKPAYKLGIAEIQVGLANHELKVQIKADQTSYPVRGQAKVKVAVQDPQGKPLPAGTPITFVAVDQALLELATNDSWDLLGNMWVPRPYSMETLTAQMHVVGKRHFGRKAAPAGGGGGMGQTRELFDTLLLWNAEVVLNDKGEADLNVPLNDSLTKFKLVAIADHQESQFGTGSTSIETRQDLQIIPAIPSLVRGNDQLRAQFTLRNATAREMTVEVKAEVQGSALKLAPQTIKLPAQASQEVVWPVNVTELAGRLAAVQKPDSLAVLSTALQWNITAQEKGASGSGAASGAASAASAAGLASDKLRITQSLTPSVRPAVQSSTLVQLTAASQSNPWSQAIKLEPEAIAGTGVVQATLSKSLLGSQTGLRRFFESYPFACLEQRTSKAIGLRDPKLWQQIIAQLPLYLDGDGLAMYFPASGTQAKGYDILTAYVLALSHEAGWEIPDDQLERMHRGLIQFVEGKISREFWSPQRDLDVRKLAAIEALSRRQAAKASMLDAIKEDLTAWPTQALIDYYSIIKRLPDLKDRDTRLKNVDTALRARLSMSGTRMSFANEQGDYWWWLMGSADLNANRLLVAVMNDANWTADISKLVLGSLGRQQRGTWSTTTANVWGSVMLEKFATAFEKADVAGSTRVEVAGEKPANYAWAKTGENTVSGRATVGFTGVETQLKLQHQGTGAPWAQVHVTAAVPRTQAIAAGYKVTKTYSLVDAKDAAKPAEGAQSFKRGDMVRVRVMVEAASPMTWVAVDDPIPAGAVVQGRGLARDSAIATLGQQSSGNTYPEYQEIGYSGVKTYFAYVPKGSFSFEYTMRLNSLGEFTLPATRVEAMYAPEVFGELPNGQFAIQN